MSFCSINIFLQSWFARQNANESPIHYKSSQQDINRQNKRKIFLNGIWSMMNYNVKWLWNYHNDDHQNTHPT
jgi:hypothetical protein